MSAAGGPLESLPDLGEPFGVTVQSRLYHADLLDAVRKLGSLRALAEYLGVHEVTLGNWVRLHAMPTLSIQRKDGVERTNSKLAKRWPEIERKLFELTGKTTAQLFPGFVRLSGFLQTSKVREERREIPAGNMLSFQRRLPELPPPDQTVDLEDVRSKLRKSLSVLSEKERLVLSVLYGLDGSGMRTLEEAGRVLKLSKERVRQLQVRAMQKLRTGTKAAEAADLVDAHPCPGCGQYFVCFDHCSECLAVRCRDCMVRGRCGECFAKEKGTVP